MAFAKEYSPELKREVSIDVDALLEAVSEAAGHKVHEHLSNEHAHMVTAEGREFTSFGELAAAYNLDIRDYTVSEANG